ncbi:hypothetical protein AgCh_008475 [Apium graveolens]
MVPVEPMGEVDLVDDVMAPEHDPTPEPEDPPIDDSDDDSTEDPPEEETIFPAPIADDVEIPQGDGVDWTNIEMYPLPTVHHPTLHPGMLSPLPYTDDDEDDEMDVQTYEAHDISFSDPDSPLPPPTTIHVVIHDWIVAQLNAEITAASTHIVELRHALTVERAIRLGCPGDFKAASPSIVRREIDGIELRTRVQIWMTAMGGYIPVVDAELMLARAMRRVLRFTELHKASNTGRGPNREGCDDEKMKLNDMHEIYHRVMKDGCITQSGKYGEILKLGSEFMELLVAHEKALSVIDPIEAGLVSKDMNINVDMKIKNNRSSEETRDVHYDKPGEDINFLKGQLVQELLYRNNIFSGVIEMSGNKAYVAQTPWIQSGTIEENSTGGFIAVARYASATHLTPSILSRGVGWQVQITEKSNGDVFKIHFLQSRNVDGQSSNHVLEVGEEDLDYNEYDEEEYVEEEADDTHQGGNPMNEFMELLRENLNQHPIPPHPHIAQQTVTTSFREFKSLKPPEF